MKHYALIDCNNFFASCEQAFDPKLRNKGVVVLSNNDGCVVARSREAKKIGIPMAAPAYKYRDTFEKYNIHSCSANFQLYGDISQRIVSILREECPEVEIYSIDESFLYLGNQKMNNYWEFGKNIRNKIIKWVGIYVTVGIAPTKTLCKIANEYSKVEQQNLINLGIKNKNQYEGVCVLDSPKQTDLVLKSLPVREVWGVGRNYSELLNKNGVYTAYDLKEVDDRWARENMSVVGQRTVLELKGQPCIEIDTNKEAKKMIISSRSFGKPVYTLEELKESVACYAGRAARKLREQNSVCTYIQVSLKTNKHRKQDQQYYPSYGLIMPTPSAYTPYLIKYAFQALEKIYKKGYRYKKAMVTLGEIYPEANSKINLFEQDYEFKKYHNIMEAFDKINLNFGKEKIRIASMGKRRPWTGKSEYRSNRFTTVWDEIPVVKTS